MIGIDRAILVLLMALGSLLGSCGAWLIMNGIVAKKVIRKGVQGYIKENPKEFNQISGKLAYNFIRSSIEHLHQTYKEDPEQLEEALKPLTAVIIKKTKDHLFSQVGVENKKARKEAEGLQNDVMEEVTGGIVSSELLDEYPLIGTLLQRPEVMELIKNKLGQSSGSNSSSSSGLIEQ